MAKNEKASLIMGGGTMLGLGVGFFFLQYSALWFVGCLMAGIGLGIFAAAIFAMK